MKKILCITASLVAFIACNEGKKGGEWTSLFNGRDLEGWTVKISGYPAGENFGNTFRVENGALVVRYDAYKQFERRFGHIFTNRAYTHYKLRVEYRFVGDQLAGGPDWAFRNSGVMLHAQAPESMLLEQDFPVSVEAQMLGGNGVDERSTGNVCTPGTDVSIGGQPWAHHCAQSSSRTFAGDQWVAMELEVRADSIVHHIVNGDTVMTYTRLTADGAGITPAIEYPNPGPLRGGRIALQSESHPVEFRRIELLDLSAR